MYERRRYYPQGLEKRSSLLGAALMTAGLHVAPNVVMKGVKSTEKGRQGLAQAFRAGIEQGQEGRKLHPNVQSILGYGVGPESLVDYNLGHRVGSMLKRYEDRPEKRRRFEQKLVNKFLKPEDLKARGIDVRDLPVVGSAQRYYDGEGYGKIHTFFERVSVPEDYERGLANKVIDGGLLTTVGLTAPGLLTQPAFAYARNQLGKSKLGKKLAEENFHKGLNGEPLSRRREIATDYLMSPAMLDTRRLGKAIHDVHPGNAADLSSQARAYKALKESQKNSGRQISKGRNVYETGLNSLFAADTDKELYPYLKQIEQFEKRFTIPKKVNYKQLNSKAGIANHFQTIDTFGKNQHLET